MSDCVKYTCPACHTLIDFVLLDAYGRFDRIGEGVMFEIRQDAAGVYTATPTAEAKDYLDRIRVCDKWNADMAEYAKTYDVFACPECGDDIVPEEDVWS